MYIRSHKNFYVVCSFLNLTVFFIKVLIFYEGKIWLYNLLKKKPPSGACWTLPLRICLVPLYHLCLESAEEHA